MDGHAAGDGGAGGTDDVSVLHVEDDEAFAELADTYLRRCDEGISVVHCATGREALDRLDGEPVDCVVSDYDMPGMDGLELLEAVRAERPGIPFVLFTGKGDEGIASDAVSAGVTEYLQKASDPEVFTLLANRIRNAVERDRARRQVDRGFRALDAADQPIAIVGADGRYLYLNEAYADVYGYEPDAVVGEHWSLLYPDHEVDRFERRVIPELVETGHWVGRGIGVDADGEPVVETLSLTHLEDGGHVCSVTPSAAAADGTAGTTGLEAAADALETPICRLTTDGALVDWNRALARLVTVEEARLADAALSDLFVEDVAAAVDRAAAARRRVSRAATLKTHSGRVEATLRLVPIEDESGIAGVAAQLPTTTASPARGGASTPVENAGDE